MRGRMMVWGLVAAWAVWIWATLPAMGRAQTVHAPPTIPQTIPQKTDHCAVKESAEQAATVEFVLSKKYKDRAEEVTRLLNTAGEPVRVRIRLFPFLDPPSNLGIGKCVSAEVGRAAIRAATTQGTGVTRLIRQDILPHHWVKVGSTDTAELAWITVSADDLKRLADPALTTEAFQTLYRELAAPKERKLPFGMGSIPLDQKP
jgi:hypothetical protein